MKKKILLSNLFSVFLILSFPSTAEEANQNLPSIRKVGEAKFQFGEILLDQHKRIVEFNATSNQKNGLIEYALVHETGKTHESLFRTKVRPQILHASLLLLKQPVESRFFENLWSEEPRKLDLGKSRIRTEVQWDQNGTLHTCSLEELSLNTKDKSSLRDGAFIFTGSKKIEGTYLAELSGSMIAVYADEEAVINSSDHDSNNDDVWIANEKQMPELETPVRIRFLLPKGD